MNIVNITIFIAIFFIGASVGSFLNVVILRNKKNEKVIGKNNRSYCPSCHGEIRFFDLIPIFSYIFLKGRCRYCRYKIPISYFLIEIITGTIFLFIFLYNYYVTQLDSNLFIITLFHYTIASFAIIIFLYDLWYGEILDKFSITLLIIVLLFEFIFFRGNIFEILISTFIGFAFFGIQFFISKGKWIGGGDLRLGAIMGAILGYNIFIALFLSYFIASMYAMPAIYKKYVKKEKVNSEIPFGPFLILGTFITIYLGDKILEFLL
ncbi:prepilin peptidase [Patescibacteria group bacterium]|nr:prepilin peptidase [Patescibacteria group bacterium]